MTWVKGQSGNPKGGKIDPDKLAFSEVCAGILNERDKKGKTLFRRTIDTLLAPKFGTRDPEAVACASCGHFADEYLVSERVIADVIFRLTEFAHGKPRQQVDLKVEREITQDEARAILNEYQVQPKQLPPAPAQAEGEGSN